ncbi:MAG: hypothetical protein AAFZ15_28070 [Bacteroidota bacterium]
MENNRPKPKALIQYDESNYYSFLGVSPLASAKEIKSIITKKQNEAKGRKRYQISSQFGEAETEFGKLQKILEHIGTEDKKQNYDRINPHNELLTVQLGENESWMEGMVQINFVSSLLSEVLGKDQFLPTPSSLPLWVPKGIDAELQNFLSQFIEYNNENTDESDVKLSIDDLDELAKNQDHH